MGPAERFWLNPPSGKSYEGVPFSPVLISSDALLGASSLLTFTPVISGRGGVGPYISLDTIFFFLPLFPLLRFIVSLSRDAPTFTPRAAFCLNFCSFLIYLTLSVPIFT